MEQTPKNPFASKTIWGFIIMGISLVASMFGAETNKDELQSIVAELSANWEMIAGTIGFLLGIYGRIKASQPIKVPVKGAASLLLFMFGLALILSPSSSQAGDDGKYIVDEVAPVFEDKTGWFVDGFSVGVFPTGANTPEPIDMNSSFSAGGGAMIGYRFNDVIAVSAGGDVARLDSSWMEHYELNIKAYAPRNSSNMFPGMIKLPDFESSEFYLILGFGAERYRNEWNTLLKGGVGVEMQITPSFANALYFIEGYYCLTGIATSDSTLDPYIGARTGIRLRF